MLKNLPGLLWKHVRNTEVLVYPTSIKYVIPFAVPVEDFKDSTVYFEKQGDCIIFTVEKKYITTVENVKSC
jgi:hypothetical protein